MKQQDQIEETNKLNEKYDDLEKYSRKNSVVILGVLEGLYPSTKGAINVDIKPEDIEISHKLKRKTNKH